VTRHCFVISITALLTVLLSVGAAVLYFNARPLPKLVSVPLDRVPAVGTVEFENILKQVLLSPKVEGNEIQMLQNGEEIFPAMLADIRAAQRSITLETFEFFGDEITEVFSEALAERAEAGLPVHVILDFVGSRKANPKHLERMEDAGVHLVRWRKPVWYQSSRMSFRTHRKLLVVDGRIGFIGSANLIDLSLGSPASGGFRENHFRLSGPIVGQLQGAFMENWLLARGELLLGESFFPTLERTGDQKFQLVQSSPREGAKRMRTCYLLGINGARRSLRIAAAYFYPDPGMKQALMDAAKRGVQIDVLIPGEAIDKDFHRFATRNRWGPLLEAGIRIHEYEKAMYHAKVLIADDSWATTGSANFNNRSFRIDDETNLNIFSPDFVQTLIEQFDEDVAVSHTAQLERWQHRPWHERFRGWLGNLIGPHL
jgi:cardiolipin synthase A/B